MKSPDSNSSDEDDFFDEKGSPEKNIYEAGYYRGDRQATTEAASGSQADPFAENKMEVDQEDRKSKLYRGTS